MSHVIVNYSPAMTLARTVYTEKGPFIITVSFAPNEVLSDEDKQTAEYVIDYTLNQVRDFVSEALSNPQGVNQKVVIQKKEEPSKETVATEKVPSTTLFEEPEAAEDPIATNGDLLSDLSSFEDLDTLLDGTIEGHSKEVLPDDGWTVKETVTNAASLEKGLSEITDSIQNSLSRRVHQSKILTDLVSTAKLKFPTAMGTQISYKLFYNHQDYHRTMMREGAGEVEPNIAFYVKVLLAGIVNVIKQQPYQGEATLVFTYQDVTEAGAFQHKHTLPVQIGASV